MVFEANNPASVVPVDGVKGVNVDFVCIIGLDVTSNLVIYLMITENCMPFRNDVPLHESYLDHFREDMIKVLVMSESMKGCVKRLRLIHEETAHSD